MRYGVAMTRRRLSRRAALALGVVAAVASVSALHVADRIAADAIETKVVDEVQERLGRACGPSSVTAEVPTWFAASTAWTRSVDAIDVGIAGYRPDDVRMDVSAGLRSVALDERSAAAVDVRAVVSWDQVTTAALAELPKEVRSGARVRPLGDHEVGVDVRVPILDSSREMTAVFALTSQGEKIQAEPVKVLVGDMVVPALLARRVLPVALGLPTVVRDVSIPAGLGLDDVRASAEGLTVDASGSGIRLDDVRASCEAPGSAT